MAAYSIAVGGIKQVPTKQCDIHKRTDKTDNGVTGHIAFGVEVID